MKLSIVVPSYRDPFLYKTLISLLENSSDTEIIPVLDGYSEELPRDPRIKPVVLETNKGMRGAMNAGFAVATGDFVMKSDSHCIFAPDFDRVLTESCQENWLMIPRRYSLEDTKWERDDTRPVRDYHFYHFPEPDGRGLFVLPWGRKDREEYDIDDTMAFQGSCWLANRKYFMEHVGVLDDRLETYGTFCGDQAEMGLKYWLNGGEIKVNKKTWYAHLKKTKRHYTNKIYGKSYKTNKLSNGQWMWVAKHWMNDLEPGMEHKFEWLIEKFWPIPTWSEDWRTK